MPNRPYFQPKRAALIIGIASVGALVVAYASQYVGGLVPCQLCLYQRPPYWIAAPLALAAAIVPFPRLRLGAMITAAIALAVGTGIAGYHVGVEQHWWGGLAGCSAPTSTAEELDEIVRLLQGRELGRCSEIPWTLFGLSMAAYNAIASAALTLAAIYTSTCFWHR